MRLSGEQAMVEHLLEHCSCQFEAVADSYRMQLSDVDQIWNALREIEAAFSLEQTLGGMQFGLCGYFAYDFVRYVEKLPCESEVKPGVQDVHLSIYHAFCIQDNSTGELTVRINEIPGLGVQKAVSYTHLTLPTIYSV